MKKQIRKKRKKKRHFRHLKQTDRDRIEALLNAGHKQEEVAKILDFDASAISREMKKKTQERQILGADRPAESKSEKIKQQASGNEG